jgi:serine/threonine-protein kinase
MATVYLGNKSGMAGFERLVAIKRCHPHLHDDEEFVSMFLDEARLAARIHHPNVVGTLDVDCTDILYLVMDYVEGDSLGALLKRAGKEKQKLPVGVVVRVMIDALRGLHAAHELRDLDGSPINLVHRDVSPQNILVGLDGISRITDFGIAFAAARSTVTQAGRIKGKFSYMAPEQVKGQEATRRIDVFGAGIVLWEALAGRPLFRRQDDAATINAVLTERVPPPSSVTPGISPALDSVVLEALRRNPSERYATAAELAEALERLAIPHATNHAVAAYVEASVGPMLAERRALVRGLLE